ncbi:MAG: hypothetical protein Q4B70_10610 [Lachnospiraceae bacterium]|nr:hypothetical protein [Lachnospiraceae bacterium]
MQNPDLASTASFSYYPVLFLVATIFTGITICISSRKPAQIAGDCSPIEAIRFIEGSKKYHKSENALQSMATRNMFRDKTKAVLVISSFVVSITIFLIVNSVIHENDSKSILNQIYSYDIEFVNETIPEDVSHTITGDDVRKLIKLDGVKNVRTVYSTYIDVPYQENVFGAFYKELYQSRYSPGDYEKDISMYKKGEDQYGFFDSKMIGIDDTELEILLKNTDEKIKLEKFHTGQIALTGEFLTLHAEEAVGKEVSFSLRDSKKTKNIKIVGIVPDPSYFASGYTPVIIVSDEYFKRIVADPIIELVRVEYDTAFDITTEKAVKNIFADSKNVSVNSKLNRYHDMLGNEKQIRILGYAFVSIILSLVIGIPGSWFVFQSMNTYQMKYSIPIISNLILFAGITVICFIVPVIIFRFLNKGSIMEKLRDDLD